MGQFRLINDGHIALKNALTALWLAFIIYIIVKNKIPHNRGGERTDQRLAQKDSRLVFEFYFAH
jgi:hypothetical protein